MASTRPESGWKVQRITAHPGEILKQEFLDPMGITANSLATKTLTPATRVGSIIHGTRSITPDTALRLSQFFGTSAECWLNLQTSYDLSRARQASQKEIEQHVQRYTEKLAGA